MTQGSIPKTLTRQEEPPRQELTLVTVMPRNEKQFAEIVELACLGASHFRVNQGCINEHRLKLQVMSGMESRLSNFGNWRTSDVFTPADRLALSLSRAISLQFKDETAALLNAAKETFSDDQLVHLCLSIVAVNDWIDLHSPSAVRILIVEDNADDRELLRRQLDKAGLCDHVLFVKNGKDAIKLFQAMGNPSQLGLVAVFLDLQLPDINGLELLRGLREKKESRQFPVIVMTSTNDPAVMRECERLEVASFVQKPITHQSFAHAVANIFHSV